MFMQNIYIKSFISLGEAEEEHIEDGFGAVH